MFRRGYPFNRHTILWVSLAALTIVACGSVLLVLFRYLPHSLQPVQIEIPLATIKPGRLEYFPIPGAGINIGVYRRTPEDFDRSQKSVRYRINITQQKLPEGINPHTRSVVEDIFVFYAIDTRWGCRLAPSLPSLPDSADWQGGFRERCLGDYAYDTYGRSLEKDLPTSAYMWLPSRDLFVPQHRIEGAYLIVYPHQNDLAQLGQID